MSAQNGHGPHRHTVKLGILVVVEAGCAECNESIPIYKLHDGTVPLTPELTEELRQFEAHADALRAGHLVADHVCGGHESG